MSKSTFIFLFFQFSYLFTLDFNKLYTGCSGHSLSFDGEKSFVQIEASDCNWTGKNPFNVFEMTYELWVYVADWKNADQFMLGQGGEYGLKLQRHSSSPHIIISNKNGGGECFFPNALCKNVPLKSWYHIAATYNGTHFFLYCNGDLIPENIINCTNNGPGKFDRRLDIGQDSQQSGTKNSFGLFDEIRGWSQFSTLEEINSRRFRTLTENEKKHPNLTFYYSFDEGDGNTLYDHSQNKLNGVLGGTGKENRKANYPKWVNSEAPIINSHCVLEGKYGNYNYSLQFKIYVLENNYTIDISANFSLYQIQLKIIEIPLKGTLLDIKKNQQVIITNYTVESNNFKYVTPFETENTNQSLQIRYCIGFDSNEICNFFKILLVENQIPFAGKAGFSFWFDGIDDYLFSESFLWPAKNYKKGFGGGPVTVEWWQLITDSDFIIDNLVAAAAQAFSIGNSEGLVNFCTGFCRGRFGAHVPWNDGTSYFDYGWEPGIRGRIGRVFTPYLNKWTHIAWVSGGKDSDENEIYFDGERAEPNIDKNLNLPAGGIIGEDLKGLVIGCWLYLKFCSRMYADEFRVWNKTRTKEEIVSTMNKRIQNPKTEDNLFAYYNFNELSHKNEILDLSNNNFIMKRGGCSADKAYYNDSICAGSFENTSISTYYPTHKWSDAPLDDVLYNITILESSNITINLNGTDLNADEISLTFLTNPQFYNITYNGRILNYGDVLSSPSYFLGTTTNKWTVTVTPRTEFAGWPLENLTFVLSDGLGKSPENIVFLNVDCLQGRFLNISEKKCEPCQPGTFTNETGHTSCDLCPLHYYQANISATSCLSCQSGYITLVEGSSFCVFIYKGCIFKNSLNHSLWGIIFNCVIIGVIAIAIILAITFHNIKNKDMIKSSISNPEKVKKSLKQKKLSGADMLDIASNILMFFQLIFYSILLDSNKSITGENGYKTLTTIKSFFSITNFDFNHETFQGLSMGEELIKGLQIFSYSFIFGFSCLSVILRITSHILHKNPEKHVKLGHLIYKADEKVMEISEAFFIPICITWFKVYSCTEESDDYPAFNDEYCSLNCWGSNHIALLINASLVFLPYSIFFLFSIVEIECLRSQNKQLHLKRNPVFIQNKFFFQLMLSVSAKLLGFEKKIQVCFILGLYLFMVINTHKFRPYGPIIKMNRLLQGIFLILFFTTLCSLLALFVETINVTLLFLGCWSAVGLLVVINVLRSPNILIDPLKSNLTLRGSGTSNFSIGSENKIMKKHTIMASAKSEVEDENYENGQIMINTAKEEKKNKSEEEGIYSEVSVMQPKEQKNPNTLENIYKK